LRGWKDEVAKTLAAAARQLEEEGRLGVKGGATTNRAGWRDGWRKKAGLGRRVARRQTGLGEERHSDNRAGQRGGFRLFSRPLDGLW
jgi:hypothetical protein